MTIEDAALLAVFDASPAMSWIVASDGRVLRANRAAAAAFPVVDGQALACDSAMLADATGKVRRLSLTRTPAPDGATVVFATDATEDVSVESMIAMLDSSSEMIAGVDRDLRFIAFNEAFRDFRVRAWGRAPQIGEHALLGVTGPSHGLLDESFRRALAGEHVFKARRPLPGDGRHLETAFSPIKKDGRIIGCVGISRDVSARKYAEQALREERSKVSAILDGTRCALLAVDRERKVTAFNDHWSQLCASAYGVATSRGVSPVDAMPASARTFWNGLLEAALRGDSSSFHHGITVDGRVRYLDVRVHPMLDEDVVTGAAVMCVDVTSHVRAEEGLRASEAKLFAVLENSKDPVWSVDRELRVVQFNSACDRLAREHGVRVVEGIAADALFGDSNAAHLRGCYERALGGERFTVEISRGARHPRAYALSLNPVFASAVVAGFVVQASPLAPPSIRFTPRARRR